MINSTFQVCTTCGGLDSLYHYLDCNILSMSKDRLYNLKYNLDLTFDNDRLKTLIRYKRILGKRLTIPNYPDSSFNVQDLIAKITLLIHKEDCNECATCFPPIPQ